MDEHVVDCSGAIEVQIHDPCLGFVNGVALKGPTLHGVLMLLGLVRLEIALRLNLELRLALYQLFLGPACREVLHLYLFNGMLPKHWRPPDP